MIPEFPKFRRLELNDKEAVENFTKKLPPYSDYNFTSLWCWDIKGETQISQLHGNLLVKFQDYITTKLHYSFIGKNKITKVADQLLQKSLKEDITKELKLIPEISISGREKELEKKFSLQLDKDNYDYVYLLKNIAGLQGRKYRKKRSAISKFNRLFPKIEVKELNLEKKAVQKQLGKLFLLWAKQKKISRRETENEFSALEKMFFSAKNIKHSTIGLFDKNELIAFSIEEITHWHYVMAHFGKTNVNYKGAGQKIEHEHAKILYKKGGRYLNYEQDLGIPGLKKAKQLWRPHFYLKKYKLFYKSE